MIFLEYSFCITQLLFKLQALNFFNLKYNKNFIIFEGRNYIIFKRILKNYIILK